MFNVFSYIKLVKSIQHNKQVTNSGVQQVSKPQNLWLELYLLGKLGSFYSYFGMWTTEHTRVCWPAEGHAPVWRPSMQPGKGFRQHPSKPGCRVRHVTSGLGFSVSTRAQKGSTSLQHMLSSAELIGWHFPHKHLSKWNVRLTSLVSFSLIAHSLARPPVRPPSLHPSSSSYVRDSVELYIL